METTERHLIDTRTDGISHTATCSCGWRSSHPTPTGAIAAAVRHDEDTRG